MTKATPPTTPPTPKVNPTRIVIPLPHVDPNEQIVKSAHNVITGSLMVEKAPGFCLKLTRQVVEHALKLPDTGFYKAVTLKVDPRHSGFWARDAQRSMTAKRWGVPMTALKPGDIVCNSRVSLPYGHIGVYVGTVVIAGPKGESITLKNRVLENTTAARGYRLGGAVTLTPLAAFDPDAAFRIPPDAF